METESQKLWIWITEQIAFRSEQFLGMSIPYVIGQWGRKFINRLDRWYSNGSLIPCDQLNVLYNCNYKLCLSFQGFKNDRQYLLSTGCRPWLGDLKVFSYVTLLWDSQSIGIDFFQANVLSWDDMENNSNVTWQRGKVIKKAQVSKKLLFE